MGQNLKLFFFFFLFQNIFQANYGILLRKYLNFRKTGKAINVDG